MCGQDYPGSKAGRKILVLIDELARTTNPAEGRALVCGVVELLAGAGVPVLITTHYSGIEGRCRRLRVRGFREEKIEGALTLANVTSFIDYSLWKKSGKKFPGRRFGSPRYWGRRRVA